MRVASFVAALAMVTGCAPVRNFVIGPTPQTSRADAPGLIDGHVAASYPVPANHPRGEVQLAVVRLTSVFEPDVPDGTRIPVVVVRMIVRNHDRQVWSVDGTRLGASIDGLPPEFPVRVFGDGQPAWVVVLEPGETRSIDLYYELPVKPVAKPSVALSWRVFTPAGTLARN